MNLIDLPDLLLALDSHTDAHFGTSDVISIMPEDVQLAAGRASSHTLIRRVIGEFPPLRKEDDWLNPDMILIIPRVGFDVHILHLQGQLKN